MHDSLCPNEYAPIMPGVICGYCALIGSVMMRQEQLYQDERQRLRKRIESLEIVGDWGDELYTVWLDDVLAVLDKETE